MREVSLGGNLNDAVRVGDTVRRRAGPWTPAVHALLHYLEQAGFEAPRALGTDDQGREVLSFMDGDAESGTLAPIPPWVMADEHLVAAAILLRRYHDVVAAFRPPEDARWRYVAPTPFEVVCHNDWSPWNALFRDGQLEAMLDWDLAGPGTRLWDVSKSAYFWAPLFEDLTSQSVPEKLRRVRLFLDAYRIEDRRDFLTTLKLSLRHMAQFVDDQASLGDPGMQRLASWDVPRKMAEDDVQFLEAHHDAFEHGLG